MKRAVAMMRSKGKTMSMRYDENRKRIICRWEEPVRVVMNKKKGLIRRIRMITVKVNDSGRLNSKDIRRHEKHPMFPLISRFNQLLNNARCFSGLDEGRKCAACGLENGASLYYDALTHSLIWRCKEHVSDLSGTCALA